MHGQKKTSNSNKSVQLITLITFLYQQLLVFPYSHRIGLCSFAEIGGFLVTEHVTVVGLLLISDTPLVG